MGLEAKVSKVNFSATGKLLSPPWEPPVCTINCGNETNSTNVTVPTNSSVVVDNSTVLIDATTGKPFYFNLNYYFPTGGGPFFRNKYFDTHNTKDYFKLLLKEGMDWSYTFGNEEGTDIV